MRFQDASLRRVAFSGVILLLLPLTATPSVVTDSFVDAVGHIESGGGRITIGDNGQAHGIWQMHADAWKDVSSYRARKGLPIWDYSRAHNRTVARIYARDYLTILENQLREGLQRAPTVEMLYAAYNIGFTRLENLGFRIEQTPRTTRAACARLKPLMAQPKRTSERTFVRQKIN